MSRDKNGQKDDFCCTNGIVECIHMIWVTTVIDMVIGAKEYET